MSPLILIFIAWAPSVLTQMARSSPEHYCYVKSPVGYTFFNFTSMQHDHNDSNIRINEDEHLRVHFCQALKEPCDSKPDYAVCLHVNGNKEIGVGKEPPQVGIEFGKIMFRYTGDKCNETHFYAVNIEMKCNYLMTEKIAADLDVIYNRDQCVFEMAIETSAACTKKKETACELDDDTGYFNLSPLTNLAGNYKVKINSSLSVILNVCHSLLYGDHYNECNEDTMVCLIDETNEKKVSYKRLGNINAVRISVVDGDVYFDVTSDTPCHEEDSNGLTIRSTIKFICNELAAPTNVNKLPRYISGYGTCHYQFEWQSLAACSEYVLNNLSKEVHQPCKITDPLYNRLYDLSMLEGRVLKAMSADRTTEYQFSVCSPLKNSNCSRPGTAVCKYNKEKKLGMSAGLANTGLTWRRGQVFLNYTDGAACGNNRRMQTSIVFYCGLTDSVIVEDVDPCTTSIIWTTNMVCNRRCATPDYKINLDKLGRSSSNYVIQGETNFTEFHLNVCEPLVNEDFTVCTDDTGICKVISDEDGKRIGEVSLGIAESGLNKAKGGRIFLRYLNGSVCAEDESKRISSEISFTCDVEVSAVSSIFLGLGEAFVQSRAFANFLRIFSGEPVFRSYENCKYNFDWRTSFSCAGIDTGLSKDCFLTNDHESQDLAIMGKNTTFKVKKRGSVGFYNTTICGVTKTCNGSFVCDSLHRYRKEKATSDYNRNLILFKYRNETKCKNNFFYHAVTKVWCNVWAGVGQPFLLHEGECSIDLQSSTNAICESLIRLNFTGSQRGWKINDEEPPSVALVLSIVTSIISAVALIVFCFYFCRFGRDTTLWRACWRNFVDKYICCRDEEPAELAVGENMQMSNCIALRQELNNQ